LISQTEWRSNKRCGANDDAGEGGDTDTGSSGGVGDSGIAGALLSCAFDKLVRVERTLFNRAVKHASESVAKAAAADKCTDNSNTDKNNNNGNKNENDNDNEKKGVKGGAFFTLAVFRGVVDDAGRGCDRSCNVHFVSLCSLRTRKSHDHHASLHTTLHHTTGVRAANARYICLTSLNFEHSINLFHFIPFHSILRLTTGVRATDLLRAPLDLHALRNVSEPNATLQLSGVGVDGMTVAPTLHVAATDAAGRSVDW
jgi:hypothetical protein